MNDYNFFVRSSEMAQLNIKTSRQPSLDLDINLNQLAYRFGYVGAPLFFLKQPHSPDERWFIESIPNGKKMTLDDNKKLDEISHEMQSWMLESKILDGWNLPLSLPPGEYLLIKSPLVCKITSTIVLGNEKVLTPSNVLTLRERQDMGEYAYVWGAGEVATLCTHVPLIGIPILNYCGESSIHSTVGVNFFSMLGVCTHSKNNIQEGVLLVIPILSSLVIDNVWSEEGIKKWAENGAATFAKHSLKNE